MNPKSREEMFARFASANPEPLTELEYASPFQLLIAVMLSAQSTDTSVNRATRPLFAAAPDPVAMLGLGIERVRASIARIGLFNTKTANVMATCALLIERHDGEVPRDRESLEALPGVGRKTANVVLNTAFGEATIAVDTHIFRVSNRTGLAPGKTPRAVEDRLMRVVPGRFRLHAHHWLILHGRYICLARQPACARCPVADLCDMGRRLDLRQASGLQGFRET